MQNEKYLKLLQTKQKQSDFARLMGTTFELMYDFGDGWGVNLTLEEERIQEVSLKEFPRVLQGAGFGIIEDCGGSPGFERLQILIKNKDKNKVEYDEYMAWLETDGIDLENFELDDVNYRIKNCSQFTVRFMKNIRKHQTKNTSYCCVITWGKVYSAIN